MTNVDFNLAIDAICQKLKNEDLYYYQDNLETLKVLISRAIIGEKVYESLETVGRNLYLTGILIEDIVYIFEAIRQELFAVMDKDTSPKELRNMKLSIDNARNAVAKGYFLEYIKDILRKIEKHQIYQKYLGVSYAIILKEQAYFKDILQSILNHVYDFKSKHYTVSEFLNAYKSSDVLRDILASEKNFLISVKSLEVKLKQRQFENAIFLLKEMTLNYFCFISNLGVLQQDLVSSEEFKAKDIDVVDKKVYDSIYKDVLSASSISNIPYCIIRIKIKNLDDTRNGFGEKAASELLKTAVDILKRSLREYDSIFKYKEDEFSIILLNANKKVADIVIDRIKDTIYRSYQYDTNEIIPEFEFKVSLT